MEDFRADWGSRACRLVPGFVRPFLRKLAFAMMSSIVRSLGSVLISSLASFSFAQESDPSGPAEFGPAELGPLEFGAREAEHLLNRAGFGAAPEEIAHAVEVGLEGSIEALFSPDSQALPRFVSERVYIDGKDLKVHLAREGIPPEEATEGQLRRKWDELTLIDRHQLSGYTRLWIDRMVRGEDPLRDRMALFWHGHFATSMKRVQNSHDLIRQQQMLRDGAFGPFEALVLGVAKSPAMLEYLGNRANRREHPNENFARELMELFTLSPGNYTELDVREAARAMTGYTIVEGEFAFLKELHDSETKQVLGVEDDLDGLELIKLILAQEACPRFIAAELLRWFEGVDAEVDRVEAYAAILRASAFDFEPFLRSLFVDPHFYSEAVVGQRVAGPFDYAVGSVRRFGVDLPASAIETAGRVMGMRLFYPETVKGWEDGMEWMTTSTVVARANFAGVLSGQLPVIEFVRSARAPLHASGSMMSMGAGSSGGADEDEVESALLEAWVCTYGEDLTPSDEVSTEELLGRLLAVEPTPAERAALEAWSAAERESFSGSAQEWAGRLAHRVLLLPSAHLH